MTEYKIPEWCGMCDEEHNDGMGGCWSIGKGYVKSEVDCHSCDKYNPKGSSNGKHIK